MKRKLVIGLNSNRPRLYIIIVDIKHLFGLSFVYKQNIPCFQSKYNTSLALKYDFDTLYMLTNLEFTRFKKVVRCVAEQSVTYVTFLSTLYPVVSKNMIKASPLVRGV